MDSAIGAYYSQLRQLIRSIGNITGYMEDKCNECIYIS